ncbi:MAG: hypothetical protein HC925_08595 [Coleofasciculaceae cyanobacterium SM2_3_26]|nr:hypothetical protein [Coleofasciculaceae cyanobacterium SM2_3_26]
MNLGRPYLNHSLKYGGSPERSPVYSLKDSSIVRSDIVLTVSCGYLELGREQWQQGQYEKAAASLEAGQALLLREGLFSHVRGEMQADLYKLRPYRIWKSAAAGI